MFLQSTYLQSGFSCLIHRFAWMFAFGTGMLKGGGDRQINPATRQILHPRRQTGRPANPARSTPRAARGVRPPMSLRKWLSVNN
jgi:hypothetical protein